MNLESLKISFLNGYSPPSALEAVKTCLNLSKRLKKLHLNGDSDILFSILTTISCKLTEFNFLHNPNLRWSLQLLPNLNLFLISQYNTLEVLEIHKWMGHDVMKTIISLPRLKKIVLEVKNVNYSEIGSWKQNLSVVDLHLITEFSNVWFEPFFEAFPKLESLRLDDMFSDYAADLIPRTYPTLRKLSFKKFAATNVSNWDFYLNLEEFSSYFIPHDLSIQLFENSSLYN